MKLHPLLFVLLTLACSKPLDSNVQKLGSTEVTAQLTEIPGPFPSNDLYHYAYVFKYKVIQVHRGKIEGDTIFVGQYNPLKARAKAEDQDSGKVGGDVQQFRAGEIHRMALEAPLDQQWMGGIVDKYFSHKGTRYWAIWTVKAS
jgi:hypothetical protein